MVGDDIYWKVSLFTLERMYEPEESILAPSGCCDVYV